MDPIYTTTNTGPAYLLNWGLSGFWRELPIPGRDWLDKLLHFTIGCPIVQAPDEIAVGYLNNAAFFLQHEAGCSIRILHRHDWQVRSWSD